MPKCKAKVLASKIEDGKMYAKIQLNGKLPKAGEIINVKWGAVRSLPQNSLYWVFLQWLIDHAGLKDQGHFFAEELHGNLKKHLLGKPGEPSDDVTTTDLNKVEFSEYFEKVDQFVQEFFEIDTAPFFKEYDENYSTR